MWAPLGPHPKDWSCWCSPLSWRPSEGHGDRPAAPHLGCASDLVLFGWGSTPHTAAAPTACSALLCPSEASPGTLQLDLDEQSVDEVKPHHTNPPFRSASLLPHLD